MSAVRCPRCLADVRPELLTSAEGRGNCASCQADLRIRLYAPAMAASEKAPPPPEEAGEGDATCFYSPERKAAAICSSCGVFISELWRAPWGAETVCLKCLEKLRGGKSADSRFEGGRVLWGNIVLALGAFPLLIPFFWFFTFITAPAALILGLMRWGRPGSLLPGGRWRLAVGTLLGLLGVLVWIALSISAFVFGGSDFE